MLCDPLEVMECASLAHHCVLALTAFTRSQIVENAISVTPLSVAIHAIKILPL